MAPTAIQKCPYKPPANLDHQPRDRIVRHNVHPLRSKQSTVSVLPSAHPAGSVGLRDKSVLTTRGPTHDRSELALFVEHCEGRSVAIQCCGIDGSVRTLRSNVHGLRSFRPHQRDPLHERFRFSALRRTDVGASGLCGLVAMSFSPFPFRSQWACQPAGGRGHRLQQRRLVIGLQSVRAPSGATASRRGWPAPHARENASTASASHCAHLPRSPRPRTWSPRGYPMLRSQLASGRRWARSVGDAPSATG